MRPAVLAAALVLVAACGQTPAEPAHTGAAPSSSVEVPRDREAGDAVESVSTAGADSGNATPPPTTTTIHAHLAPELNPPEPEIGTASVAYRGSCGGWADLVERHFPAEVGTACQVLVCESRGNPTAVSVTNDHGLMQLNAGTARWPGGWQEAFAEVTGAAFFPGAYDPELNLMFAKWLRDQEGWSQWACWNRR